MLNLEDNFEMYFIQQPVRVRQFEIGGIYESDVSEFDDILVIGDIRHIQKLNNWSENDAGSLGIQIDDFSKINQISQNIYKKIGYNLNTKTVIENNPQLFDWLELQNMNVRIIIILMLIVGAINMITALFILILERTQTIGILKALGSQNWQIREIFIYYSSYLIIKGLFWGNILGVFLCFIQKKFQLIKLDKDIYYMSYIPIDINLLNIINLNIGTFIICFLTLIAPSYLITKINPIKSIKFE